MLGYNVYDHTSLSGNASEARKTAEAKELVFRKLLAKGVVIMCQ